MTLKGNEMKKYSVTAPNGQVITNYSSSDFSHAVLTQNSMTQRWLATWSKSLESAQRQLDSNKTANFIAQSLIVEVAAE